MYIYFKRISGVGCGNHIYFWVSKGLSDENVTAPTTSDYIPNPQFILLFILILKQEQNLMQAV